MRSWRAAEYPTHWTEPGHVWDTNPVDGRTRPDGTRHETAPDRHTRWSGPFTQWWQVKDSNLGSFRDGFTVRSHWPSGNLPWCADHPPSHRPRHRIDAAAPHEPRPGLRAKSASSSPPRGPSATDAGSASPVHAVGRPATLVVALHRIRRRPGPPGSVDRRTLNPPTPRGRRPGCPAPGDGEQDHARGWTGRSTRPAGWSSPQPTRPAWSARSPSPPTASSSATAGAGQPRGPRSPQARHHRGPRMSTTTASETVVGTWRVDLENHLPDPEHDQRQPHLEVGQAVDEVGEQELQRPHPEQREGVGSEDEEGPRRSPRRWLGSSRGERRRSPRPGAGRAAAASRRGTRRCRSFRFPGRKIGLPERRCRRDPASQPEVHPRGRRVEVLVPGPQHAPPGEQQDRGEDVEATGPAR